MVDKCTAPKKASQVGINTQNPDAEALLGLQRFFRAVEHHLRLATVHGDDSLNADLAAGVFLEIAKAGPVVVPDHNGEVLARIPLIDVDERRFSLLRAAVWIPVTLPQTVAVSPAWEEA